MVVASAKCWAELLPGVGHLQQPHTHPIRTYRSPGLSCLTYPACRCCGTLHTRQPFAYLSIQRLPLPARAALKQSQHHQYVHRTQDQTYLPIIPVLLILRPYPTAKRRIPAHMRCCCLMANLGCCSSALAGQADQTAMSQPMPSSAPLLHKPTHV